MSSQISLPSLLVFLFLVCQVEALPTLADWEWGAGGREVVGANSTDSIKNVYYIILFHRSFSCGMATNPLTLESEFGIVQIQINSLRKVQIQINSLRKNK